MTAQSRKRPRKTVTLTHRQVAQIMYDMGWEPIDADVFWQVALGFNKAGAR